MDEINEYTSKEYNTRIHNILYVNVFKILIVYTRKHGYH